jgi:hypothetical protein
MNFLERLLNPVSALQSGRITMYGLSVRTARKAIAGNDTGAAELGAAVVQALEVIVDSVKVPTYDRFEMLATLPPDPLSMELDTCWQMEGAALRWAKDAKCRDIEHWVVAANLVVAIFGLRVLTESAKSPEIGIRAREIYDEAIAVVRDVIDALKKVGASFVGDLD